MVKQLIGILIGVIAVVAVVSAKEGEGGTPDLPGAGVEPGTGLQGLSLAQSPVDTEKIKQEAMRVTEEPERRIILSEKVQPESFNIFEQQAMQQFTGGLPVGVGVTPSPVTQTGLAVVTEEGEVVLGTSPTGRVIRGPTGGAIFIPN